MARSTRSEKAAEIDRSARTTETSCLRRPRRGPADDHTGQCTQSLGGSCREAKGSAPTVPGNGSPAHAGRRRSVPAGLPQLRASGRLRHCLEVPALPLLVIVDGPGHLTAVWTGIPLFLQLGICRTKVRARAAGPFFRVPSRTRASGPARVSSRSRRPAPGALERIPMGVYRPATSRCPYEPSAVPRRSTRWRPPAPRLPALSAGAPVGRLLSERGPAIPDRRRRRRVYASAPAAVSPVPANVLYSHARSHPPIAPSTRPYMVAVRTDPNPAGPW